MRTVFTAAREQYRSQSSQSLRIYVAAQVFTEGIYSLAFERGPSRYAAALVELLQHSSQLQLADELQTYTKR